MTYFIPGLKLNEDFFKEVVGPLMREHFPNLRYAAGLVGHGSDTLGFDSPKSTDHNWGPHLQMFFTETDFVAHKHEVDEMLRKKLPYSYRGYPTHFIKGDKYLKDTPKLKKSGEVNHLFGFWTIQSFFIHYLGFNIEQKPSYRNWLLFPQQALVEVTAGQVFHDHIGLEETRLAFAYYPDDIWKYMMRVQWGKILDELQMQARTGEEGDEIGSMIVTARMIQKIMFLCFLQERTYAPYSKWFGTAFTQLTIAQKMYPLLLNILHEGDWAKRQRLLAKAYQLLGKNHNALNITKPLSTKIVDFFGRGYPIIDVWEYVHGIEKVIENETLRTMRYPLGSVDQFIDHARINQMDYFYTDLGDIIK